MELVYWSDRSSSMSGGDGVKGMDGGIVIVASCKHHFIRVYENLVQHKRNNTMVIKQCILTSAPLISPSVIKNF